MRTFNSPHGAVIPSYSLYRGSCHPSAARLRHSGFPAVFQDALRSRQVCHARLSKKDREAAEMSTLHSDDFRPWKFEIPTVDAILEDDDWPLLVKNWETFWGVFLNWLQAWGDLVLLERGDEDEMTSSRDDLAWLQVYPADREKVEQVIDKVVAAIPELQYHGYPVPESLPGKKPWHVGHWKLRHFQDHMGRPRWEKREIVGVNPLWSTPKDEVDEDMLPQQAQMGSRYDGWDEWEFRAFMEKRKAHRRKQAEFARRQAEIGTLDYLTVSPLTDSRLSLDSPFYPHLKRDPTHEECMERVRMYGKAVDPETINVRILDPAEKMDAFVEGIHYVPDTVEFLRSIGHLTENEEDLIGVKEVEAPSATLEEEFLEEGVDDEDFDQEDDADLVGTFDDADSDVEEVMADEDN